MYSFYEFFAGAGMARAGLGSEWSCLFANDFDHKKGQTYSQNWGGSELTVGDVKKVSTADLPESPDLVWASFPCQDLSLAGGGAGLKGDRSGTFWPFWKLMHNLIEEDRPPKIIALENVIGTLTSHQGKDFAAIAEGFRTSGYRFGAIVVDASLFVPHSRPRLFMIGVHESCELPECIVLDEPNPEWHTKSLMNAWNNFTKRDRDNWIWWNPSTPPIRESNFVDLIEEKPTGVDWHTAAETKKLLSMMSPVNAEKVKVAQKSGRKMVGAIYKRTRKDENGNKVQRAEVRFDDIAGCLRTPAGGSSRQLILVVEGKKIRSRLLSTREAARLMGLPDTYAIPHNYNEGYHLMGDGVAVPVVRFLASQIFEPLLTLRSKSKGKRAA